MVDSCFPLMDVSFLLIRMASSTLRKRMIRKIAIQTRITITRKEQIINVHRMANLFIKALQGDGGGFPNIKYFWSKWRKITHTRQTTSPMLL